MSSPPDSPEGASPPSLLRHLLLTIALALAVAVLSHFVGEGDLLDDATALALVLFLLGTGTRQLIVLLSSLLFWLAFPPVCLPTYWLALAPLVWSWRYGHPTSGVVKDVLLFVVVSFWLLTPFVRGAIPTASWYLVYVLGMLLFGLQFLAFALVVRLLRHCALVLAAPAAALVAVGFEWFYSVGLGSVLVFFMPAADSPIAQLSWWISPFGVSFVLYLINCCLLPGESTQGYGRWLGPICGMALALSAWLLGFFISRSLPERPMPISAYLVQPQRGPLLADLRPEQSEIAWLVLDRLTKQAIRQHGECDLIVWPESALETSYWEENTNTLRLGPATIPRVGGLSMTLHAFASRRVPEYRATCIAGVVLRDSSQQVYNSACLLRLDGSVSRYDKQKLLWLVERVPTWLDFSWMHQYVLPHLAVSASFVPGRDTPGIFTFQTRDGKTIRVGLSICYELFFHDLPQFRPNQEADVIVHITNDSLFRKHTAFFQYEVWMCQYRAIQTRTWLLLCNNWSHSAVIDPTGKVRRILPAGPAVLRTD